MPIEKRAYSGNTGSPIQLRNNAPRQTEERVSTNRYRQSPRVADETEIDDGWTVEKPHSSAIRYDRPAVPTRGLATQKNDPYRTQLIKERRPFMARVLVIIGLSLLVLSLGIMAFNALANWWQRHTDDVTYGMPRTFQTDQYVGHGDSSRHPDHFIALNLNGTVEIMEINPQDIKLDHAYYITNTDPLNPVTLTFPTIDGKQYMYISIGEPNSAYSVAMVNDGKEFIGVQH